MSGESIAWGLAAASAAATAAILWALTKRLGCGFWRAWLLCTGLALMLTPAPVPGFDGHLAPAFIVALFEALFQLQGHPGQSFKLLLAACLAATALAGLWAWLGPAGRRRRP